MTALPSCGGSSQRTTAPRPSPTTPQTAGARGAATRTEESAHDRASIGDDDIAAALRRRLARDDALPPNAVAVAIDDGVVTLSGTVPHLAAAHRAYDIAAATRGVRDVVSRIDVRAATRDDAQLATEVRRAIELDPALGDRAIEVEVHDGAVAMRGMLSSLAEARLADEIVSTVRGVRAIDPAFTLEPSGAPTDEDVRDAITRRLERDVRLDPAGIRVSVENGRVTLSGVVGSVAERDVARELAEIPGALEIRTDGLDVQWWARDTLRRSTPEWDDDHASVAVRETIARDPRARAENVVVNVARGLATLRGTVPDAYAKDAAVEDALTIVGVTRVGNQLVVRADPMLEDATLEQRVEERLAASAWTSDADIDVTAREGRVTLRGTASSRSVARAAREIATRVTGVREVEDAIALDELEPLEDWDLAGEVRTGLVWNPFLDRMNVQVVAREGVVTLRGEVDDVRAFREAAREASDAGATEVVNELSIRGQPTTRETRRATPAPSR